MRTIQIHCHILRAAHEEAVSTESAVKIIDGFETDEPIEVTDYKSQHHILTRKAGRLSPEDVTEEMQKAGVRVGTTTTRPSMIK